MAQTIKLKTSATPSDVPTTGDLILGELAVNTNDGKIYLKKDDGSASIVEIAPNSVDTVFGREGDVVANVNDYAAYYLQNINSESVGDLSDVTATGLQAGDFLLWNGSAFVNQNFSGETAGTTALATDSVADMLTGKVLSGTTITPVVGQIWKVTDYYGGSSPSNSGTLTFEVVATGTGTADGGSFIDGTGVQFKQIMKMTPSIKDFGAVVDRTAYDHVAIQNAITWSFLNSSNLDGAEGVALSDRTIFLPYFNVLPTNSVTYDFKGLKVEFDNDVDDGFVSGKLSGSTWVSAMNDPVQTNMSFGFYIKNLSALRSGVTDINYVDTTGFKLKDFHQNAKLENLTTQNFFTGFYCYNNFYAAFLNCMAFNDEQPTGPEDAVGFGFIFERQIALMELTGLKATNVAFGYVLKGFVSGTAMNHCSFEGQYVGLVTQGEGDGSGGGEVYGLAINNAYIENVWGDTVFRFANPANVTIDNCFFNPEFENFSTKYAVDAQAGFFSNIDFRATNLVHAPITSASIFKNQGATASRLALPQEQKAADLSNYKNETNGSITMMNTTVVDIDGSDNLNSIAKVNNGMCEGNYSGRMNAGGEFGGVHGVFNINHGATSLEVDTAIDYSDTGLLYINFEVVDNVGTKTFRGFMAGTDFHSIGGTGSNPFIYTAEGFVRVIFPGLVKPAGDYTIVKGEVRII
ncbi:hypothetical protein NVP1208B_25 [Vibrio phage 1.208.B._10N.222.52.A7]|nr:hypothetical protein NVP1208B_25 [Vibrio phage 1.208.B._10N.222.52.A7]